MSNILAIDTTDFSIALALMRGGEVVAERRVDDSGIAERLMLNIQELFGEVGIEVGDLNKIAVIVGPGSFTGIRSGLATVLGICAGAAGNIEVVPVSKLHAQAFYAGKELKIQQVIFSLLTANASEYFAGVYYGGGGVALSEMVPHTPVIKSELDAFVEGTTADSYVKVIDANVNFAVVAAEMATVIQGTTNLNDLKPLYIKPVNAKTLAERGL